MTFIVFVVRVAVMSVFVIAPSVHRADFLDHTDHCVVVMVRREGCDSDHHHRNQEWYGGNLSQYHYQFSPGDCLTKIIPSLFVRSVSPVILDVVAIVADRVTRAIIFIFPRLRQDSFAGEAEQLEAEEDQDDGDNH